MAWPGLGGPNDGLILHSVEKYAHPSGTTVGGLPAAVPCSVPWSLGFVLTARVCSVVAIAQPARAAATLYPQRCSKSGPCVVA